MAERVSASFPKSARLLRRADFVRVQDGGQKAATDLLLGLALRRKAGETRVGFTVSKKVGTAVERNRVRRRLRELVRTGRGQLPEGLDVVLVARQRAVGVEFAELRRAFETVAAKLKGTFR